MGWQCGACRVHNTGGDQRARDNAYSGIWASDNFGQESGSFVRAPIC